MGSEFKLELIASFQKGAQSQCLGEGENRLRGLPFFYIR